MLVSAPRDIYYVELTFEYLSGKRYKKKEGWVVAYSDDILDIMQDEAAIKELMSQAYREGHKSEKKVIISKIHKSIFLGREVLPNKYIL